MAVYTKVDSAAVSGFLEGYDLGPYKSHAGITQGVENTNYHLYTNSHHAILTIFEKRIRPEALPFVFGFVSHLEKAGLDVPGTYKNRAGQYVGALAGKPAAIIHFLEGSGVADADITPAHCARMGHMLARMHVAAAGYTPMRENPMGLPEWRELLREALPVTDCLDGDAKREIAVTMADYESIDKTSLPRGAIHADVFPDNVFFKNGELTGVIDFYFACTDAFVYDLAITLNAWCFTPEGVLLPERFAAFAGAYESVRPLAANERAAFPFIRRAAALRILSTRLYDWVFTPADAAVVRKAPQEYLLKLKASCTWP